MDSFKDVSNPKITDEKVDEVVDIIQDIRAGLEDGKEDKKLLFPHWKP